MDPNATLARIFAAIRHNDKAELLSAFQDLSEWLEKGNCAPLCTQEIMGMTRQAVYGGGWRQVQRTWIGAGDLWGFYAIMSVNPNDHGASGFKFVAYDSKDEKRFERVLPSESARKAA